MYYEFPKIAMTPGCTITDSGVQIKKSTYPLTDLKAVKQIGQPTKMTNGVLQLNFGDKKIINIGYKKDMEQQALEAYEQLSEIAARNVAEKNSLLDLSTADGMYQYCLTNGTGRGASKGWAQSHFGLLVKSLQPGETVKFCFIGLHNYISATKHDGNFAFAVTDKRILMAQQKVMAKNLQSISWDNVNDVTLAGGALVSVVTIDTFKETFNVGVNSIAGDNIYHKFLEVLHEVKDEKAAQFAPQAQVQPAAQSPIEQVKGLKELLDMGAITQEEFDAKKKELLGL